MATQILRPVLNQARRISLPRRNVQIFLCGNSRGVVTSSKQALDNVPETRITELENGLRVATEDWGPGVHSATVGLYFDAGSRYERDETNGTGYLLENMIFKGSSKFAGGGRELEQRMAEMGALMDAHTGRDGTAVWVKCMAGDVRNAVEVLADVCARPTLDPDTLDQVREGILRSRLALEDDQERVVMDYLHGSAYQGTPMAYSPLGTTDNIRELDVSTLREYHTAHWSAPTRMVLAGCGGSGASGSGSLHEQLVEGARSSPLAQLSHHYPDSEIPMVTPCRYTGSEIRHSDDTMPAAYVALAVETPGRNSPDTVPLLIASQVVGSEWDQATGGGPGIHHPWQLAAYCYDTGAAKAFRSFMHTYTDTGLWGTYFVTPRAQTDDFMMELLTHWKKLFQSVPDEVVNRAKNQLKARMFLQMDGTTPTCQQIGEQVLWYGRRVPMSEMVARINAVDADTMHRVCAKYLFKAEPTQASIGAVEQVMDYSFMRGMLHITIV